MPRPMDPIVAAVNVLFEHRHELPADALRSLADIWVCGSAARYGAPHEAFWEDEPFARHNTAACESDHPSRPTVVAAVLAVGQALFELDQQPGPADAESRADGG